MKRDEKLRCRVIKKTFGNVAGSWGFSNSNLSPPHLHSAPPQLPEGCDLPMSRIIVALGH